VLHGVSRVRSPLVGLPTSDIPRLGRPTAIIPGPRVLHHTDKVIAGRKQPALRSSYVIREDGPSGY
jgi:hypothetical protein